MPLDIFNKELGVGDIVAYVARSQSRRVIHFGIILKLKDEAFHKLCIVIKPINMVHVKNGTFRTKETRRLSALRMWKIANTECLPSGLIKTLKDALELYQRQESKKLLPKKSAWVNNYHGQSNNYYNVDDSTIERMTEDIKYI